MERDLLRRRYPRDTLVTELKEEQESSRQKIPPENLPFSFTEEQGKISSAELKSPGVYLLSLKKGSAFQEVYAVTADAPAISETARSYGQVLPGCPDLRIYDLSQPGSGRHIIDFELRQYQMKHHLPENEERGFLHTAALYGMEEHPEYFGGFPVPMCTPRGYTVRHKMILNGVYWLETDRCEELLAVCYPIWQADISIPEQNLGEQLEQDRLQGIDNTLGYLFFPAQDSPIPLYELSLLHPEIKESGAVNMAALLNAICKLYPEYVAIHNAEESKYERGNIIKGTLGAGTEFIKF